MKDEVGRRTPSPERTSFLVWGLACLFLLVFSAGPARGYGVSENGDPVADLLALGLEDLMEVEVVSPSKKKERLYEAATAIFVITQDDIRRSGAASIPEVLRMVPGLHVARIDSNKWAVTSRGFNGRFANKLLVLMDGRSVYTPLFSGVYWDVQDTLLDDIERIEVIRGPGATLWGANAVNGVVNIITKSARETRGGLLAGGAGNEERAFMGLRYGGTASPDLAWRMYGKWFDRDGSVDARGGDTADEWRVRRTGFRADWNGPGPRSGTFQGDVYEGDVGARYLLPALLPPYRERIDHDSSVRGGNLLGRWEGKSTSSEWAFQAYFDRTERRELVVVEERDTCDLEWQHRFALGAGQEVIWGLGYRYTRDQNESTAYGRLDPSSRSDYLFSAFFHDEITVMRDLHLAAGTKLEHNGYTGVEVQPNIRFLLSPRPGHVLWGAVSRAVRMPSRADHDVELQTYPAPPGELFPFSPVGVVTLYGDGDADCERLLAYELGYRFFGRNAFSLDVALFYNEYDELRTGDLGNPFVAFSPSPPHLVFPVRADNNMWGETYGVEVALDWQPMVWWRIRLSYSFLETLLHMDRDSTDLFSEEIETETPGHQFFVRSSMDIAQNFELDLSFRFVDGMERLAPYPNDIPAYFSLDARVGWLLRRGLEFAIVGQNLLDDRHPEFMQEYILLPPMEIERSVYGKVTWRY